MKNNVNITNENDRNIKLELPATYQSANASAQAADACVGHGAATPAGLRFCECVGLRQISGVGVGPSGEGKHPKSDPDESDENERPNTESRSRVEGRKSVRPGATRTQMDLSQKA